MAVAAGMLAALLFVVVGVAWDLQLYGDGSLFAYAIAVEDSWAIHWHNIVGRVTVYLATCLPSEIYVHATGDARGAITLYGSLFFSAQMVGLAATYLADRSASRWVFTAGCLSTACICPLVFGFPTEMWFAHALLWPSLAISHYAPWTAGGFLQVLAFTTALVHTHGGGVIFAVTVLTTTALRRPAHSFVRAACVLGLAFSMWVALQAAVRPSEQIAPVLMDAAVNFIDPRNLLKPVVAMLVLSAIGYLVLAGLLRRVPMRQPAVWAIATVAGMLALYWRLLDHNLLAEDRYFLRTALFYLAPALAVFASATALQQEQRLIPALARLPDLGRLVRSVSHPASFGGALALILLVHFVETAKFVSGWTDYKAAIGRLATVAPRAVEPGGERFVSVERLPADLSAYSWSSTTSYLSVLAVPELKPNRLIVDPDAGYQWIDCTLALRHSDRRAVPTHTRRLIEARACEQ